MDARRNSRLRELNCSFSGNKDSCIGINGVNGNVWYGVISNNIMDLSSAVSTAHGIYLHGTTTASSCNFITITGNIIKNAPGFGIEVGAFGGNAAGGVVISDNTIQLPASCNGGISLGGVSDCSVTGNTILGASSTASIGGIELAGGVDITASGNTISLGASSAHGFALDPNNTNLTNVVVSGNLVNGFGSRTGIAGIYCGISSTGTINNILISGNVVVFPASGAGLVLVRPEME